MTERIVNLTHTSASEFGPKITVSSLEDLEALCVKYDTDIILSVGDDGKLSAIEVYDDYRE